MTIPQQHQKPHPSQEDQRGDNEQSGSTGRRPGKGDRAQDGTNTGQDDYGMTGSRDRTPPGSQPDSADSSSKQRQRKE